MSNAFKFTPKNGTIFVEIKPIHNENGFCQKIPNEEENISLKKDAMKSILRRGSFDAKNPQLERYDSSQSGYERYYLSFEIRIQDSGRGISKENQEKLFLNFSKLADEEGVNKTGTGLGLSICKHLIEKMGGHVKVESKGLGYGTTFVIKMQAISKIKACEAVNLLNQNNSSS